MSVLDWLFGSRRAKNSKIKQAESIVLDRYKKDNLFDVGLALGCLVTCVGDSFFVVCLQDKNDEKGWPSLVQFSVTLDNWQLDKAKIQGVPSYEQYRQLEVPEEVAGFLVTIPFVENRGSFEYEMNSLGEYPSVYKSSLANEIRKGCALSPKSNWPHRNIKVEESPYGIFVRIDG